MLALIIVIIVCQVNALTQYFIVIIRPAMSQSSMNLPHVSQRGQRIQADLTLLLVAVIWGSAFVVQRIAAVQVGVFWFNGLRFLLGALVLLPFARQDVSNFSTLAFGGSESAFTAKGRRQFLAILTAGCLLWAGAAFQQTGLVYTTAANAGFITGLYVVLIPLFLALRGRQSLRLATWAASLLAASGLFLLSTGGQMQVNPGDGLELAGAVFWALHVILIGWMVQRIPVLTLAIGQYLVCALLNILTGLVVETGTLAALANNWWVIAYAGALSVGLGYTLQAKGQRLAPPADAAIILCSEAVFAALFGWLFLDEKLSALQLVGCGVMLAGMLLAQSGSILSARGESEG
jgi:drug/metabolite transporter (DMT)-like permease